MSIPLYFPAVNYVPNLSLKKGVSLRALCKMAGVKCRATGPWTERQVEIISGKCLKITAEPGDWGAVKIEVNARSLLKRARVALAALAYGMQDLVAKQSIINQEWTQLRAPKGRPKTGCALTGAERQRKFRQKARRKANIKILPKLSK